MSKTVKTRHLFGLLEKFVITDIGENYPYLIRWQFRLPFNLATVKLHKICRPDTDRCHHDHPWGFVRIILTGGYEEVYGDAGQRQLLLPGSITYCPPSFRHRITSLVGGGPSWSLVFTGPRVQEWGFYTRAGWVQWEKFVNALRGEKVLWCDDGYEARLEESEESRQRKRDLMLDAFQVPAEVYVPKWSENQTAEKLAEFETLLAVENARRNTNPRFNLNTPVPPDPDWIGGRYCPRFDCQECGTRVRGVRYTTGADCSNCPAFIAPWTIQGPWPLPYDPVKDGPPPETAQGG